jgi:hypothetical protein
MPRKIHAARTLRELFALAREIGEHNVLLNDVELGAVLAGSDTDRIHPGTISNMRGAGRLRCPVVRIGRTPRTRLADALAERDRELRIYTRSA